MGKDGIYKKDCEMLKGQRTVEGDVILVHLCT